MDHRLSVRTMQRDVAMDGMTSADAYEAHHELQLSWR